MSKNVKVEYVPQFTDGFVDHNKPKVLKYVTCTTDDLKMPSMLFDKEEDAELVVAIARAKQARGIDYYGDLLNDVRYTFRTLGLTDNGWAK